MSLSDFHDMNSLLFRTPFWPAHSGSLQLRLLIQTQSTAYQASPPHVSQTPDGDGDGMSKAAPCQLHHPTLTPEFYCECRDELQPANPPGCTSGRHPPGLALQNSPCRGLNIPLLYILIPCPSLIPSASARVKPSSLNWALTSLLPLAIQVCSLEQQHSITWEFLKMLGLRPPPQTY